MQRCSSKHKAEYEAKERKGGHGKREQESEGAVETGFSRVLFSACGLGLASSLPLLSPGRESRGRVLGCTPGAWGQGGCGTVLWGWEKAGLGGRWCLSSAGLGDGLVCTSPRHDRHYNRKPRRTDKPL